MDRISGSGVDRYAVMARLFGEDEWNELGRSNDETGGPAFYEAEMNPLYAEVKVEDRALEQIGA